MNERRPDRGADASDAQEEDVHSLIRTGPAFAGPRPEAPSLASDAATDRPGRTDARSLRGLYAAYHADVLRAAHRITGNLQDAEDVVQTVFLRIARGGAEGTSVDGTNLEGGDQSGSTFDSDSPLEGVKNPGGYLQRSAVNAALDLVRGRIRRPTVALDNARAAESATESDGDSSAHESALRERLRRAISALHPSTAEIFALRYFEGFTNRQIADMLGTTQSSIGVSLHRARTQLKRVLADEAVG